MTRILLRNVEKFYGEVQVLFDCNLQIESGEFMVLVGPSGSGKTTLLRLIAGLESLSGGDLFFGEQRVNDIDVGERDIAMVFQNYGLYPHMNVFNNMAFGLKRRHVPRSEIDARVRRAAELLNITSYLQRRPKQLSGGQRQRVALGRAIVRDPKVFLLDEPLSNLDAHLRAQMRTEILKVHHAVTATAVYVTHDQIEALTMGDRIVVMAEGRIHQVGTPDALYDRPDSRFVASFIGTPAMGFFDCPLKAGDGEAEAQPGQGRIRLLPEQRRVLAPLAGRTVTVGIRPERLALTGPEDNSAEVLLPGVVDTVEMLGSEQYVRFQVAGGALTTRVPREQQVRPSQPVTFRAEARHLYLFHPESGAALR